MDSGNPLKKIWTTFFTSGFKTRKTQVFWIFSFIPFLIAAVILVMELTSRSFGTSARQVFFNSMMVYYFQLLLPVLALFSGSSIINDEIENRTLVYLTTSVVPKPVIFLGKYLSHYAILAIQLNTGFFLTYVLVRIDGLGHWVIWENWLQYAGISLLALFAYSAFFTFLGTLMRKSVMIGLFFIFGWENIVQYFPGVTQKFTIIHYIKSLLPALPREIKFLIFQLEPSNPAEALAMLALITFVFIAAATILFQKKEFILSDSV